MKGATTTTAWHQHVWNNNNQVMGDNRDNTGDDDFSFIVIFVHK
jgi:hypothetical protein